MAERRGAVEGVGEVNRAFWQNRRVLVTGHTGFKGYWLTLWLRWMGARVAGFSLPDDVRDAAALAEAVQAHQPEAVFHLAAQPLVRVGYQAPAETYATNVMGTVHLLDAVRMTPSVRATVVVTSDKCYENRELQRGYRESDPLGGVDPYSSSKAAQELVAGAYRRSYGMRVATARAGNVIGGNDWAAFRLVPDCVRAFAAGQPVEIRHPEAVRPWQHVLEPLAGYLLLAERLHEGEPGISPAYNFGPSDVGIRTVGELVSSLAEAWGEGAAWSTEPDHHHGPPETNRLLLNAALARQELGWQPRLALRAAVEWTVEWYKAFGLGDTSVESLDGLTVRQIQRYESLSLS